MRLKVHGLILVALIAGIFALFIFSGENKKVGAWENTAIEKEDIQNTSPQDSIIIYGKDCIEKGGDVRIISDRENEKQYLYTGEEGYCQWSVDIKEPGNYNILVRYMPDKGKGAPIERVLYIDEKMPFPEGTNVIFKRAWENAHEIKTDNRGNDIYPMQVEALIFLEKKIENPSEHNGSFSGFYLTEGEHRIKLKSIKEPMIIDYIKIYIDKTPTYRQLEEIYKDKGYGAAGNDIIIKVQGEDAIFKSDSSIRAKNDRSSPKTEPSSPLYVKLNSFGGDSWKLPGEWAVWEFDVPESGLYKVTIKYKQNYNRSLFSTRRFEVDGIVPCSEMNNITFTYHSGWDNKTIGEEGKPYLIYLKKGNHRIKLEATTGEMSRFFDSAVNSLKILNNAYSKIFVIIGAVPDPYRDYQLEKRIPEVFETFKEQIVMLSKISMELQELTGKRGSEITALENLVYQMNEMVKDPDSVRDRIVNFKSNLGALGGWVLSLKEQPLLIDYFLISSPDGEIPSAEANIFGKIIYELKCLAYSYFLDYGSIGNVSEESRKITVWISTGRDQANILKRLIESSFTPKTGVGVNLKFVLPETIIPSIVAGRGPDVVVDIEEKLPMDFAIRDAICDLSELESFYKVKEQFMESALVPFTFMGKIYALPEKQTFNMLFYRKDILDELELTVPNTWDDVYSMIPVLARNKMEIGIPSNIYTFATFLYQNEGQFYNQDGSKSMLESEESMSMFKKWTDLFFNYKLPVEMDFVNRFRTGEMPVGIVDFSAYNILSVFAPEISGLWDITTLPGFRQTDGSIDISGAGIVTGCIMLKSCKEQEAAWEFMKWWTGKEAQAQYGRELENLLGEAARYPTANILAFDEIQWKTSTYNSLTEQRNWVKGIPQVPGGYYMQRHLDNAFRKVINTGEDPRETLLDYILLINGELLAKRKEFGF